MPLHDYEPWFPAALVPLKGQKCGGFRGPGSPLFYSLKLQGGIISLICLQSLSGWLNPGGIHFFPKEVRLS